MSPPKTRADELRDAIQQLDLEILDRLEQRARLSREIHGLTEGEASVPDVSERDYLQGIEQHARGDLPLESLRAVFSQIKASGRALERPTPVAYVGPEGNFCQHMARGHFGANASFIECHTVQEVLEAVARERASYGVFAFDSSVEGLNLPAISALAETDRILVAERTLRAVLCLMNATGSGEDVETIYCTAAAHAACELFVERELPRASVLDVRSPVEAAELARREPASAAIVPEVTGRARELRVIRDNIGDEPELRYRFGVVGTRPTSRTGNDTTCLLFSLDDAPGKLFQVLSHFAERGINLKKIQSRPASAASWDYIFYVEVSGHATDRPVVTALEAVKGATKYLKLLGSFPTEP